MPFQHTREPYNLDDGKYDDFARKVTQFLDEPASAEHRPTQFVAEQIIRAEAFAAALDAFNRADTELYNATQVFQAAVKGLAAKLLWFKYILPRMVIGPDTLLAEFGLHEKLPKEYAKIKNLADEVWSHWLDRRDEDMFEVMLDDGDLLEGLITSYENALAAQNTAQNTYHEKSLAKNKARESHHEIEREIFNWYKSFYPDVEDDYWTNTPWGKASQNGEEPTPTEFECAVVKRADGIYDFSATKPPEVAGAKIELQQLPDGPVKVLIERMLIEEGVFVPHRVRDLVPGDYKAFFTAFDEEGAQWGDVVVVEFTVEPY